MNRGSIVLELNEDFGEIDLDSTLGEEELLGATGEVTVSIGKGKLGKVRLRTAGPYVDRFAQAKDPRKILPAGTLIEVVEIKKDGVVVAPSEKKEM